MSKSQKQNQIKSTSINEFLKAKSANNQLRPRLQKSFPLLRPIRITQHKG